MLRGCLLLFALSLLPSTLTADRPVCIDDRVGMAPAAIGAFHKEFVKLLAHQDLTLVWAGCESEPTGAIALAVLSSEPRGRSGILGLAYRQGRLIRPRFEVYLQPILDMHKGFGDWDTIGRALARVAAHEVGHWLEQREDHTRRGLMRATFSWSELAGQDSHSFRFLRSHNPAR